MNTPTARRAASVHEISLSDALALLPDAARIHTFQPFLGLHGCNMDRDDVLAAVRASLGCWLSTEVGLGHELRITYRGRWLFVKIDAAKALALRDHLGAATG
jgi:hypothetical protein